ncbi:hypothetical protein EVAR_19553_1 [Eumeta japonica]|uniref:Uncharacterized protein n=1 Tax=Eumeta variegata TaxID=151549 RepID=A0A4C1UF10_EUMVA|nr:hypothetical protein EVAR_19553_1 [Eumeta japonica]
MLWVTVKAKCECRHSVAQQTPASRRRLQRAPAYVYSSGYGASELCALHLLFTSSRRPLPVVVHGRQDYYASPASSSQPENSGMEVDQKKEPKKRASDTRVSEESDSKSEFDIDSFSNESNESNDKGCTQAQSRKALKGLKVQPAAILDFRNLSVLLATPKVAYQTYSLKEECEFHVVLRGVPKELPIEEVKEDSIIQNLPV